jgi:hypothetical protein
MQTLLQWRRKNISHSGSLFVALGIQDATRMRHIVICNLPGCTMFCHIISYRVRFKKILLNIKSLFCFSLQLFLGGEIFHSQKKLGRRDQIYIYRSS